MKDVARFFKVLADEARLKMLWLLFNHQELCVCDIMAALEITQSKASRHLSTLRHADLVTDRKEGLWSYYALRSIDNELVRDQLAALRKNLAQRSDALQLLAKLRAWLAVKNRSVMCAKKGACAAAKKKAAKRTPRVTLTGGMR